MDCALFGTKTSFVDIDKIRLFPVTGMSTLLNFFITQSEADSWTGAKSCLKNNLDEILIQSYHLEEIFVSILV